MMFEMPQENLPSGRNAGYYLGRDRHLKGKLLELIQLCSHSMGKC